VVVLLFELPKHTSAHTITPAKTKPPMIKVGSVNMTASPAGAAGPGASSAAGGGGAAAGASTGAGAADAAPPDVAPPDVAPPDAAPPLWSCAKTIGCEAPVGAVCATAENAVALRSDAARAIVSACLIMKNPLDSWVRVLP